MLDMNGAAAAERAGYSQKTSRAIACELLTKPDIQAVLRARQAVMANELQITREGVIRGLVDAVGTARLQKNPMAMISGLRELGRMMGFYAPEVKRIEVSPNAANALANYSKMSDHELIALISSRR
jgi:hypothetical protein